MNTDVNTDKDKDEKKDVGMDMDKINYVEMQYLPI
jgi:hypothetical protein